MKSRNVLAAFDAGEIEGTGLICLGTSLKGYQDNCGTPPPGVTFLFNGGGQWATNW